MESFLGLEQATVVGLTSSTIHMEVVLLLVVVRLCLAESSAYIYDKFTGEKDRSIQVKVVSGKATETMCVVVVVAVACTTTVSLLNVDCSSSYMKIHMERAMYIWECHCRRTRQIRLVQVVRK